MQYERNLFRSVLALMEISAGRFLTYVAVGAIAGLLGSGIPIEKREWFTAAAYLLLSVFLILTTFRTHQKEKCYTSGKWASIVDRPFVLGLITGINICPSFLIALTKAVDLSGPMAGIALFSSFFVGTSLFLLPLSFFGFFGVKKHFRVVARFSALVIGVWFITQAIITINSQLNKPPQVAIDPNLIIDLLDSSNAYILSGDSLSLKNLKEKLIEKKRAPVQVITNEIDLPEKGVIYIGQEYVANQHIETHPFRKAGRFIVILPDSSSKGITDKNLDKMIKFFAFYKFKIDPDSGSIYQIPAAVLND
jgi:sulfite exporter TauE/SafE